MQCQECRWFVIGVNDHYGSCKRYPKNENKNQTDFCGEFTYKPMEVKTVKPIKIEFTEPTLMEIEHKIVDQHGNVSTEKPKRGRKPKNVD